MRLTKQLSCNYKILKNNAKNSYGRTNHRCIYSRLTLINYECYFSFTLS